MMQCIRHILCCCVCDLPHQVCTHSTKNTQTLTHTARYDSALRGNAHRGLFPDLDLRPSPSECDPTTTAVLASIFGTLVICLPLIIIAYLCGCVSVFIFDDRITQTRFASPSQQYPKIGDFKKW